MMARETTTGGFRNEDIDHSHGNLFDVEAASFFPWAVQMHQLRYFGLVEMVSFVVVLAIGYAYVWRRGGFQWR